MLNTFETRYFYILFQSPYGGVRGVAFLRATPIKGQAQGLLEPADPDPVVAEVGLHVDVTTVEVQVVRELAARWVTT